MTAEAVVLGSGTSSGVPALAKTYPPEFLANPKNHRTRPSLLVRGETGNLLVDCAPEMRLQLLREKVESLEAAVITHTHADHVMGMDDLRTFSAKLGKAFPIYTLPEYMPDIRRMFAYAFEEPKADIWVPRFELRELPPELSIAGVPVEFFTVNHGEKPVVALRINGFAYVTDVSEIPEPAWARLQNLDVLILDGVRYRPHPNHFHYEKAVEIAKALGAHTTYLTHLSDDYDHDVTERDMPNGIRLAFDGLRVPL
jgi:phosphoribosyl 1,2-cyclic phosphate phosphodiesterase